MLSLKESIPMWSRPLANCPTKSFAAEISDGQDAVLFIDPDRSSTIIATTSRRLDWPITPKLVESYLRYFMNQVGTTVVAVIVIFAMLGTDESSIATLEMPITVLLVAHVPV